MAKIKWKNFGRAKVATPPFGLTGLTFAVQGSKGELFPALAAGEHFYGTFTNADKTSFEVVKIVGRSNDVFTIETGGRGLDSTGAQEWYANDYFYYGLSASALDEIFTDSLLALSSLTGDVRKIPYFVNATDMALADLWPYGLGVLNTSDAVAARTYLNAADATAFDALAALFGQVKNSAGDASSGFLGTKIVAGPNISVAIETDGGGVQTLKISAPDPTPTGATQKFLRSTAPPGWIKLNGFRIGDASSNAEHANADAEALFKLWWSEFDDTLLPLYTSAGVIVARGASANADWAAHRQMRIFDDRGEFDRGWDDGRGIDSGRALGSWQGDMFKSHTHDTKVQNEQLSGGSFQTVRPVSSGGTQSGATGGVETRPRNIAKLSCVKL